jgi:hypothetical protein
MLQVSPSSPFRVDKRKIEATLTLTTAQTVRGHFFLGESALAGDGHERIDELLNRTSGFFPFERLDGGFPRVVLYNTAHVCTVSLLVPAAREVPGYEVAPVRRVSLLLSTGHQVSGQIRVYLPHGSERVSDWARDAVTFRFIETAGATLLVNIHHVAEIIELESK